MNKIYASGLGLLAVCGAMATNLTAVHNDTIEYYSNANGDNYTSYSPDSKYFDFGTHVTASTTYYSFGTLDFDATSISGMNIVGADLVLADGSYSGSVGGQIQAWAVTDNTTALGSGTTIQYDKTVTGGYSGQLGSPTLLATWTFVPGANPTYTYALGGWSQLAALASSSSHDIRIVLTGDGTVYGTYGGVGTGTIGAPVLSVETQAVPEPAEILPLVLGAIGLIARRRKA